MDKRIALLFSTGIGTMGFNRMLNDDLVDELDRLDFLLCGEMTLFEVIELREHSEVPEINKRIFVPESSLPYFRQIEHRKGGLRSQIRRHKK